MRYNPGDVVRVRYDLNESVDKVLGIMPDMIDLAGKAVVISRAFQNTRGEDRYEVEGNRHYWSNECLIDFKPIPSLLDLIGGDKREV